MQALRDSPSGAFFVMRKCYWSDLPKGFDVQTANLLLGSLLHAFELRPSADVDIKTPEEES